MFFAAFGLKGNLFSEKKDSLGKLAFGHATMSVIVRNQTIDKNFPSRGNAFFIIFKNTPKFEYREFVSAIYATRKFDSSSSTSI